MMAGAILFADSNEPGILSSIFWGVVSFVVSRWAWDIYERKTTTRRLKHVLLLESFATLRRLSAALNTIREVDLSGDAFYCLRAMPSTLVFAAPNPELSRLFTLLGKDELPDVFKLLDRWARIVMLTAHYEMAFDNAISAAAKCNESDPLMKQQCREYMVQVVGTLQLIYNVGSDACFAACTIIRRHGPACDEDLKELASRELPQHNWQRWQDCCQERDLFAKQASETNVLRLCDDLLTTERGNSQVV